MTVVMILWTIMRARVWCIFRTIILFARRVTQNIRSRLSNDRRDDDKSRLIYNNYISVGISSYTLAYIVYPYMHTDTPHTRPVALLGCIVFIFMYMYFYVCVETRKINPHASVRRSRRICIKRNRKTKQI